MIETVLRGLPRVQPRPEGGRNLVFFTGADHCSRVPLTEEEYQQFAAELAMTEEELIEHLDRQRTAAQIVLPGAEGSLVSANGNGHNG